MSYAEDFWRSRTDEEVAAAAGRLFEYTEEGDRIIRDELRRRGLAQPAVPVASCRRCGRSIYRHDPNERCGQCDEPYPDATLAVLDAAVDAADESRRREWETDDAGGGDFVTVGRFPTEVEASLARGALEAAGIVARATPENALAFRFAGTFDVQVRPADRERALGVLASAGTQPDADLPWDRETDPEDNR